MAITATNKGGSIYEPVEAGAYCARCFSMIHIGTIEELVMGQLKKMNKVRVTFELPTELKVFKDEEGEKPYVISKEYTLSMHEKSTLRKHLEGWRGKAFTEEEASSFDVTKLLGKPCTINVIHKVSEKNGNKYAEITSISPVMKGMVVPDQINENYEFNYDPFIASKFDQLPQYLRDKMVKSDEYREATKIENPSSVGGNHKPSTVLTNEDDLPF